MPILACAVSLYVRHGTIVRGHNVGKENGMCKALLFLRSLEDVRYAVKRLGFPVELIPQLSREAHRTIRILGPEDLEDAYQQLCRINISEEFAAVRHEPVPVPQAPARSLAPA
jgi:hypothetical protein